MAVWTGKGLRLFSETRNLSNLRFQKDIYPAGFEAPFKTDFRLAERGYINICIHAATWRITGISNEQKRFLNEFGIE